MKHTVEKLRRVSDEQLVIHRVPYGRGFRFKDEQETYITDKHLLKRLKSLVIPPMWSEVLISKWADGHIQATGRDAKGRKQYIYHSEWERLRQEEKFDRMKSFAKGLPEIRKKAHQDLAQEKWTRSKVQALVVLILDETGIRIGNRQYADRNGTYGLTTLRRKHLDLDEGTLSFTFKGKSSQEREVEVDDAELISLIKKAAEQPGYELFRYKDAGGYQAIDSDAINDYIHAVLGDQFSSKDFRTWVASRLAIEAYPAAVEMKRDMPRRKLANILLRIVADELGNTPTVCKSYYVHPTIMELIESQAIPDWTENAEESDYDLSPSEQVLVELIS